MSDTPRTDANLQSTGDPGGSNTTAVYVFASFARQLERELNAANQKLEAALKLTTLNSIEHINVK